MFNMSEANEKPYLKIWIGRMFYVEVPNILLIPGMFRVLEFCTKIPLGKLRRNCF